MELLECSSPKSGNSTSEAEELPTRSVSSIFLEAVKTVKQKSMTKTIESYIKENYNIDIIDHLPTMGVFLRSNNQETNNPKQKEMDKAPSGAKKPAARGKANIKVAKKATAGNKAAKKATLGRNVAKKATARKVEKKATAGRKVVKKATAGGKVVKKATVGSKAKKALSAIKLSVVTRSMAANTKNANNDLTVKEAAGGTKTVEKIKSAENFPERTSRKTSKQDAMDISEGGNPEGGNPVSDVGSVSDAEAVDDCGHSKWKYINEARKRKERREARSRSRKKRSRSRSKKRKSKSPKRKKKQSKSQKKKKKQSKSPKKKKKRTAAAPKKKKTTKSKKQTAKRRPKAKKKR